MPLGGRDKRIVALPQGLAQEGEAELEPGFQSQLDENLRSYQRIRPAMETTEKIVEAYVRYVKGWATIPNVRCDGQYEIDLLAIDPVSLARYHIETSVSGSQAYSRLTAKAFWPAAGSVDTRLS